MYFLEFKKRKPESSVHSQVSAFPQYIVYIKMIPKIYHDQKCYKNICNAKF